MVHGDNVDYIISNNPNFSLRDCYENPDYKGTIGLFDKKVRRMKGVEKAIDYVLEHNLINVIVSSVVTIMKLSDSWQDFMKKLNKIHPKYGENLGVEYDGCEDDGSGI